MKKQYKRVWAILITMAAAVSCTDPVEYNETPPDPSTVRAVIANEGQYGAATASLTAITIGGEVKHDLFRAANDRPLGDMAQSITEINGLYYVTLNNSHKVEVLDAKTFKSVATIVTDEGTIPTYVAHLGGDSIAITDKGDGMLVIAKISTGQVIRQFEVGSSNQMKVIAGKLFLAGSTLRAFELGRIEANKMITITDKDDETISVVGDSKILSDKNGNIWVFNSQRLVCIDPATYAIVSEIPFTGLSIDSWGGRIDMLPGGENIIINTGKGAVKGVMKVHISAQEMPTTHLFTFPATLNVLYNMVASNEGTVFVCDVLFGSLARGKVHEFAASGEVINSFEAGIFPQYIHFTQHK